MRINHNLSSMTTQTSMFRVNRDISKSLQKLSTGLRINTAADDAAGLGVSENLRTQVRGMSMAFRNTQDAIAMLQIADGALNEQAELLQRMREIVIQAKNDTYTQTERDYMYEEFSGLMSELDRIAAVTNYNGMRIFAPLERSESLRLALNNPEGSPRVLRDARDAWDNDNDSIFGAADYASAQHFNMMIGANYTARDAAAYNSTYESYQKSASNMLMIQFGQMDSNALLTKDQAAPMGNAYVSDPVLNDPMNGLFDSFRFDSSADGEDAMLDALYTLSGLGSGGVSTKLDYLLKLIDGNDEGIPDFVGLNTTPNGAEIPNGAGRGSTHNLTGLTRVSHMRSNIGAMINRLDHASNNLLNQISNTQSAESLIRDADFAHESANFTKNQILSQSSTSMLAQSNMIPQSVLQLLG